MVKIDHEYILSTGEVLAEMSQGRLEELSKDINKLSSTLGRTAHYERKNRTNIQCLRDDYQYILCEVRRRRCLHVVHVCGIRWHWVDIERPRNLGDGQWRFVLQRDHGDQRWIHERLELTRDDLDVMYANGARYEKLPDPLGSPWSVLDHDPDKQEPPQWFPKSDQ